MATILFPLYSIMYTGMIPEVLALTSRKESVKTVRYVERCPIDLKSWEKAAKNMKCEAMKHNCLHTLFSKGQHRIQYHCLINTWMNATFEVCAPNRTIFGYCTEFNVLGRVIQENYKADCTSHNPPCLTFYNSAEAYKYQTCYDLVRQNRQKTEYMYKNSRNPDLRSTSEKLTGNFAFTFLTMCQMMHARVLI